MTPLETGLSILALIVLILALSVVADDWRKDGKDKENK